MHHNIDKSKAGPMAQSMKEAITACVHCGFCLPSCPTYQELGEEMDSPRGRIYLMKQVLEGKLDAAEAQPHIDRCLGCLACETSCPSGVPYHQLLSPYRSSRGNTVKRSPIQRLKRFLVLQTLPYPGRFRFAVRFGGWIKGFKPLLPKPLRPMINLMPSGLPPEGRLSGRYEAQGNKRARVAMLTGCVQRVLEPEINRATVEVLTRNGVEVIVPEKQGCCGSLAWHVGEAGVARRFAQETIDAFPDDVDAVIVNAAGCGSGMSEYPLMFEGSEGKDKAKAFSRRVTDVSVFLDQLGIEPPPPLERPLRVAYHDACHLCHGQRIRAEPRGILKCIEGLELLELADGERCCGSAGTYNIDQPEIAAELGKKKADAIHRTECDLVATGNIGCMVQIRKHLEGPPVLHSAEVLALAYAGRLNATTVRDGARKPFPADA